MQPYIDFMRYGLTDNATNPLRDYIKSRGFVISKIADQIGLANQSLHGILSGKTARPRRENLESLAEALGMELRFDKQGPYFEISDPSDKDETVLTEIDDPWVEELLPYLKEMGEEERRSLESIVKVLSQKSKIK